MKTVKFTLSLILLFGSNLGAIAQSSVITTYAGLGRVLPAAGTPAINQPINTPNSVIPDVAGGFYFASEHRVYGVAADGTVTVIAGTGVPAYGGDGGPAPSAELRYPSDLALDADGNLFIADTGNNRVRKVTLTGMINTVAGTGIKFFGGDGGLATHAQLDNPSGITVDAAGNLFIADTSNHRIRKVTPEGLITTVAGTGQIAWNGCGFSGDGGEAVLASLCSPSDVAVDAKGNLLIADSNNHRIRRVSANGIISTVAASPRVPWDYVRDGDAVIVDLGYARTIGVDRSGNVFVGDVFTHSIVKLTPDSRVDLVAGTGTAGFGGDGGPASSAQLNRPAGVAVDAEGNILIADAGNNRIRRVTAAGIISSIAGNGRTIGFSGDSGPARSAELNSPTRVALDNAGNLFIADTDNHRIRRITQDGFISTVAGTGTQGFSGDAGPARVAQLSYPSDVLLDAAGNLVIVDSGNLRIRKVNPAGIINTLAGGGHGADGSHATVASLYGPGAVALDADGNLFIVDYLRIRKVNTAGVITTVAGTGYDWGDEGFSGDGGPAIAAKFNNPSDVAVDADGNLFIADTDNHRIRKVTPDGIITTVAGNGQSGFSSDGGPASSAKLSHPRGLALDRAGNLFIADAGNNRIRKVGNTGVISTVAGTGELGFSGDFGPPASARLNVPTDVAVDVAGDLFIADSSNHRIRRITTDLTGIPGDHVLISAVYPRSGPTGGGTRLRILGRNFQPGSTVRLGGLEVMALKFKSAGELTGLTPPLAGGTYSVEVVQPNGEIALVSQGFTYLQLTQFKPMTPTSSPAPIWRIPFVVDTPEVRTNLGINNVGSVTAAVKISLVDYHGFLIAQASTTVPPFGMHQINHIVRFLESSSEVTGREGYLILESEQDIRAWASQVNTASLDPSFELARSESSTRALLPSSVSNERLTTKVTIINTSATNGQVSLRLRDSAGALQASLLNQPIGGYGYLYIEDVHKAAGLTNTSGPIEIEGHNGLRVLATAQVVSHQNTGGYFEAVDPAAASHDVVLYSLEDTDFRTNLGINNPGTEPANVTIRLLDKNGLPLGSIMTTVPAGGMTQLNHVNSAFGSESPGTAIEGTLRLQSDRSIVAWTSQIDNLTEDASFEAGKSHPSAKLLIPSTTRVGGFGSNLVVANLDASPATVELKFRDADGNLMASRMEVIPGNGLLSSPDVLGRLGVTAAYGPLEIVSLGGKPILAVSRVSSPRRTAGTFEGVP